MNISDADFEALITRAMNELPQKYIKGLDNVVVTFADVPDEHQKGKSHLDGHHILLGLYEGIPLTQRGAGYTFVLPDKITLFKFALEAISPTPEALYAQVKRTLWHEMAHYYGLSHADMDARLHKK